MNDETPTELCKRLKKLVSISGYDDFDLIQSGFFDISQIIRCDNFSSDNTNLTFDQIIQLKGKSYEMGSNEFDDEKLSKYLQMLKNGKTGRNLKFLRLYFTRYPTQDIDGEVISKDLQIDKYCYFQNGSRWSHSFCFNCDDQEKQYSCEVTSYMLTIRIQ